MSRRRTRHVAVCTVALVSVFGGCSLVFDPQSTPAVVLVEGGRVDVPMDVSRDVPIIEATVNGTGPYRLLVDTGAFTCILDQATARAAGCPVSMRFGRYATAAGSTTGRMDLARVDELAIGGASFRGFECLVADLSDVAAALGHPLDGVIGYPLIEAGVWTIDYPGARLVIDSGAALAEDDPFIHAIRWSTGTPTIGVLVDEQLLWAEIDTGSNHGLDLSHEDAERVEFQAPLTDVLHSTTLSGMAQGQTGALRGTLRIGGWRLPAPTVALSKDTSMGGEILKAFRLTIDARSGRVRLEPVAQ